MNGPELRIAPPEASEVRATVDDELEVQGDELTVDQVGDGIAEDSVRAVLGAVGGGLHMWLGDELAGPDHWRLLDDDLDAIGPPLTRILRRYPAAARLAQHSDEAAVAIGTGTYVFRNMLASKAANAARELYSDEPIGGAEHGDSTGQADRASDNEAAGAAGGNAGAGWHPFYGPGSGPPAG